MAVPQFWGVDSWNVVDQPRPQTGTKTLFQFVSDNLGRPPDFWGRYLRKPGGQPPLAASELTHIATENQKWGSACKVLLVFQLNISHAQVGTEQTGRTDAKAAKTLAQGLNIPAGQKIAIYADLEYTMPALGWLRGWIKEMSASPSYFPGIYSGIGALSNLFGPFPPRVGTPSKLDEFFPQPDPLNPDLWRDNPWWFLWASQSGPFLWWITNPMFQGPTPPKFVAKDKPFDLSAFDLDDARDVDQKKTRPGMDPRLKDLIVLWQYATNWDSQAGGTFKITSATPRDQGGHPIGEVDMNVCSQTGFDAMFSP